MVNNPWLFPSWNSQSEEESISKHPLSKNGTRSHVRKEQEAWEEKLGQWRLLCRVSWAGL
jgi:hypothetical protein